MSLHIACAADEKYSPYCAAMLHSLLTHNREQRVVIHFLHAPDLPLAVKQRLVALTEPFSATVQFHQIADDQISGLPEMQRIPRLMWFRVLLPQLLPHLDRVLYLDADTLVVDSLLPLWQTDLAGHYLGAVTNVIPAQQADRPRELGLSGPEQYFNSGVLLFNLQLMREERCSERIFEYARINADRLLWPDQDGLNVILAPRRVPLHPRWNCQNTLYYWPRAREVFGAATVSEATTAPAILHFEGPDQAKPWHYLNDHPYREQYRATLQLTGFPVPPVEGRSLRNIIVRHAPPGLLSGLRQLRRVMGGRRARSPRGAAL